MPTHEVNFDGLVGPTHNYAGLATGNEASRANRLVPSHPREAALQGLAKMKALADRGLKQALIPPLDRPSLPALRRLGFDGPDTAAILQRAKREAPQVLAACCSASSMWVANAATVAPSVDTADGRVHFTPANLASNLHRSIEAPETAAVLRALFPDPERFVHHPPLAGDSDFADEGAANHTRFAAAHGARGLHHFVVGRSSARLDWRVPARYPARQTLLASETVARQHLLPPTRVVFTQQLPEAIDAGVFHNDVIATGTCDFLLYHEQAFERGDAAVAELRSRFRELSGAELKTFRVATEDLSLADAVRSYLFNSQLLVMPDGRLTLVAPAECQEIAPAHRVIERMLADEQCPLQDVLYFDLRQSMKNGGGPACLRLRVVLNDAEIAAVAPGVFINDASYAALSAWVRRHYRETLLPDDLADPALLEECRAALDELTNILGLGALYDFQQAGA
ncbi:MAG: N-succinylarginine dihydrolase [Verrucomicrobia bacterium]|nr:N-succinylarginine dihydrolase [Verrucomicrobiota bacterium]